MTFVEFYRKHFKYRTFFAMHELPDDVRQDLQNMINNEDKRLGFFVCSTIQNIDGEWIREMTISYYIRSWHPHFIYNAYNIPVGLRFWYMRRVATA